MLVRLRNLSGRPQTSMWLQTSTDRFYPDFVAELLDGRILMVEYKEEGYVTNDDSKEKRQLGEKWESASNGKALFLMAEKCDRFGHGVEKQIQDKIKS